MGKKCRPLWTPSIKHNVPLAMHTTYIPSSVYEYVVHYIIRYCVYDIRIQYIYLCICECASHRKEKKIPLYTSSNAKTMGIMTVYLLAKQNELFCRARTYTQHTAHSQYRHTLKKFYLAFSKMHQKSSGCNCVQLLVNVWYTVYIRVYI